MQLTNQRIVVSPIAPCRFSTAIRSRPLAAPPAAQAVKESTITSDALVALLASGAPVVLLDARAGKYDDGKRIPGAKSLNDASTPEQVAAVVKDKNALIVTYCAGIKCPASVHLAEHLRKLGYTNVREYREGIEGWLALGKAVEQGELAK